MNGKQTNKNIEKKKEEAEAENKLKCSFKPKINKLSAQIAQSRSLGRTNKKKHEVLYEQAALKEEQLGKIAEDFYGKVCTFRPKTNPAPPEIADKINKIDFMGRAQQLLIKKEEH